MFQEVFSQERGEEPESRRAQFSPDLNLIKGKETAIEMAQLVQAGVLPESCYLLLDEYTPCSKNCAVFTEQSQEMYHDLEVYLGKERADEILKLHREQAPRRM